MIILLYEIKVDGSNQSIIVLLIALVSMDDGWQKANR